jgi:C-terminal processing protease CtpA/Prc
VLLEGIDNRNVNKILDSLFQHLSADGYNLTHKYQTVSNGSNFRSMYASLYGLRPRVNVSYIDSAGYFKQSTLAAYNPKADSQRQAFKPPKLSKRERRIIMLNSTRSLKIDTTLNTAVLEVNAFTKDSKLRSFFRQSFKKIRKEQIPNLIVDMRGNGGGSVTLSNLLTKYIASAPFKIADSLYAIKRSSKYGRFRENQLLNWLFLQFLTRKKADGHYHFTFFENKYFKPKTKNHFNGTTYILTGGNTFSAATLFTKALVKQENVIVVGEETGGGAYGNTAWLIPDVTLPNTKVRFRLPLFRLVVDRNEAKGHGVYPEVEVVPTVEDIRKGNDYKMDKVKQLIKQRSTAGY